MEDFFSCLSIISARYLGSLAALGVYCLPVIYGILKHGWTSADGRRYVKQRRYARRARQRIGRDSRHSGPGFWATKPSPSRPSSSMGMLLATILSFEQFGKPSVAYLVGKPYWGKGVATRISGLHNVSAASITFFDCRTSMSRTFDGCVFRMLKGIDNDDPTSC